MDNPFQKIYDLCNSGTGREKLKNLPDFPRYVDIELTNTCNLKCDKCPTGTNMAKRPKGFMTGNVFHKILAELKEHKTPVRFVRWGEPTLHPELYNWIRECRDAGLLTHINTNGVNLDVDKAIESGLDSLKVSIHPPYNRAFRVDGIYSSFVTYDKMRDLTEPSETHSECPEVFDKLSIDWDGKVTACCADYDRFMTVGDVKHQTLKEIWKSPRLRRYRELLAEFRHDEIPLCRCCK